VHRRAASFLALLLGLAASACTCEPTAVPSRGVGEPADGSVEIQVATAPGPRPVVLVLDPSGVLCARAIQAAAGQRHVLCDRTKEDLSAAALKRGLTRLKAEHGPAVVPGGAWLVTAPGRAAVARSLAVREPAFFCRVAAWVGASPVTAGLFGPGFLAGVEGRGFQTLFLLGAGAEQAESWVPLAARQNVRVLLRPDASSEGEAATVAILAEAFALD